MYLSHVHIFDKAMREWLNTEILKRNVKNIVQYWKEKYFERILIFKQVVQDIKNTRQYSF